MVELVEVEDESFQESQPGPAENDDDYYTDTGKKLAHPSYINGHFLTGTAQNPKSPRMTRTKSQTKPF